MAAQLSPVLGQSPELRRALEAARRVAPTDAPVFITGETGTGKELLAHYIHSHSPRRRKPLVPINCAALPEGVFESEMFGHRRGAFTGAVHEKTGLLEAAHEGTIFLDELLELLTTLQAKLLRVLQDGVVRRVGSAHVDAVVDVRVISATNRDPTAALRAGELREDLFHRLHVVPIHLPALRERPEDVRLLATHFFELYWTRHRGTDEPLPRLSAEVQWALSAHPWPGNVRELQNTIEHLAVLAEPGSTIAPDEIPFRAEAPASPRANGTGNHAKAPTAEQGDPDDGDERDAEDPFDMDKLLADGYQVARDRVIEKFERRFVDWFVRRSGGNLSRGARLVGTDRSTIYRLLKRHGSAWDRYLATRHGG